MEERKPIHWQREVGLPVAVAVTATVVAGWLGQLSPLDALLYIGVPLAAVAVLYMVVRSVLRLRRFLIGLRERQDVLDMFINDLIENYEELRDRVLKMERGLEHVTTARPTGTKPLSQALIIKRQRELDAQLQRYPPWVREAWDAAKNHYLWDVIFTVDSIIFQSHDGSEIVTLDADASKATQSRTLSTLRQAGLTF